MDLAEAPEACPEDPVAYPEVPAALEAACPESLVAVLTACRVAVPAACPEGLAACPEGLAAASEVACPAAPLVMASQTQLASARRPAVAAQAGG